MSSYYHSVEFDRQRCRGTMTCMRVCPTEAIRIRRGKAELVPERCIDCGLCLRACPHGAIASKTDLFQDLQHFHRRVAIPSPLLYGQFGADTPPSLVRTALLGIGFDEVYDLEEASLEVAVALEDLLSTWTGPLPLLTNWCPALVRLLQVRFPELTDQVIPIRPPREIAAQRLKEREGIRAAGAPDLGAVYITPCPAKMIAIQQPAEGVSAWLDSAIGIDDLYNPLMKEIHRLRESGWSQEEWSPDQGRLSDLGMAPSEIGWCDCGKAHIPRSGVTGMENVIKVLEDLGDERLAPKGVVECFTCRGGCAAGALCVETTYATTARIRTLLGERGAERRSPDRQEVLARARSGYFDLGRPLAPRPISPLSEDLGKAVEMVRRRDRLQANLPGINCGLCGAPTCESFAEDCIRELTEPGKCIFLGPGRLEELKKVYRTSNEETETRTLAWVAQQLNLRNATPTLGLDAPVAGAYASDLLSDVMGHAQAGQMWLTLQVHLNIVAVASLRELSAILLVGGREPQEATAAKAVEEGIPILVSDLDTFQLAGRLFELGLRGGRE